MSKFNPFAINQLRSLSRRDFIRKSGGCAALSSTAVLGQLLNLQMTSSVMAQQNAGDYKALVCLFLFGGNDSFNMLTPYEQSEYDDYAGVRTNLAIPRDDLLAISDSNGRQLGLHPGMAPIKDLYDNGNATFVANVGSMVGPTDLQDFRDGRDLPLGMFSHSDFIKHWQSSGPHSRSQVNGWCGRVADILTDSSNLNPHVSMNIALNSSNLMQTGAQVIPYQIGVNGATTLQHHLPTETWALPRIRQRVLNDAIGETYNDLLEKAFVERRRDSRDGALAFQNSLDGVDLTTEFPESSLGSQLKMVARCIKARESLQQNRQIFFVSVGGWDHHDELIDKQAAMLPMVAGALRAFYDATVELGLSDSVTTFTASDFARTLTTNGDGSDHAWGGNALVMGGAVNGNQIYGTYPESLALGTPIDTGRGRLVPTTSVDEYNAELAHWFGVPNDDSLESVLPNVRNFFSAGGAPPLGFLG